jgi:hypothetical protein
MIRYPAVHDALIQRGGLDKHDAVDCGDHMIHAWKLGNTHALVVEYWSGSHAECQIYTGILMDVDPDRGRSHLHQINASRRGYLEAGLFRQFSTNADEHFIMTEPQSANDHISLYQQRVVVTDAADLPLLDALFDMS